MTLVHRFTDFIRRERLFNPAEKLLLTVSGGLDSVVLCELCEQAGYDFAVAHCNFQLRGEESRRDEIFTKDLAEKYGKEWFVKKFETEKYVAEKKCSVQVAARELRYKWFHELLQAKDHSAGQENNNRFDSPQWIVTAHHADDNIETLLMNFFKGTGITGLRGMLPSTGKIRRPLLFARKAELQEFGKEHNLSFVEDSSNAGVKYTRNYFRNELIPGIEKVFPQVEQNLFSNIARFSDIEILYRQALDAHRKKMLEYKGAEVHIPVLKLLQVKPLATLVYELTKPYGFTPMQSTDIIHLLQSESGRYVHSATHRVIRNRKWLIISPIETELALNVVIDEGDHEVTFDNGLKLKIERCDVPANGEKKTEVRISSTSSVATLNASMISFPLLLRKWKKGDYFYPLGMQKKKKLSRFFIDQKLSILEKENVWVIESDKKVIWVVGRRIDDRFKVTNSTKAILQISLC
ncbi:MAG: tRNA lysidine(34) synthetase TilS [Ginsengibacter sp.]